MKRTLKHCGSKLVLFFSIPMISCFSSSHRWRRFRSAQSRFKRRRGKKGLQRSFIHFGHSRAQRRFELRIIRRTEKLVTLACILSMKPQILLLDEPTNGLDVDSKQRLIEVINKINAAKIVISHDPEMLSSTCTKFSTIRNCRIESIAKPEMHEHWHTHFYGGVPHTHHEST